MRCAACLLPVYRLSVCVGAGGREGGGGEEEVLHYRWLDCQVPVLHYESV